MERLVYSKTPEEYTRMYLEAGQSCMSLSMHKGKLAERIYNHCGLLSSCLYSYIPGLQGVSIERDGKLINRGFVYNGLAIIGFYGADIELLVDALIVEGYEKCIHLLNLKEPIKVLGVEFEGSWYCPVPYCDFIKQKLWYGYDDKTHEWSIVPYPFSKEHFYPSISSAYDYPTWVRMEDDELRPKERFAVLRNADFDWVD